MFKLTNKHLIIFVLGGMVVATTLVLNSRARLELEDSLKEQYEKGVIDKDSYREAVIDGKITNWEALNLKKN